jgi:glycosyltransferase involved in cell wall biosynthesis
MRHVLILTHDFPPLGGGGVQRPLTLCRYLPALGYEPVVVTGTGASGHWQPRDDELAQELPNGLPVFRLPAPEPDPGVWDRRAARWLGHSDAWSHWWKKNLVETGLRAAQTVPVSLVYAWMQPYQTAAAARELARRLGVPWVAELGDPWAFDEMIVYASALHRRAAARRMGDVLGSAAAIVMSTPEAARRIAAAFPSIGDRVSALPFGYNGADFEHPVESPWPSGAFRIVHTGTLHTDAGRGGRVASALRGSTAGVDIVARSHIHLIEAVSRVRTDAGDTRSIEVHLAGMLSDADEAAAASHPFVHRLGFVPHPQALAIMRSADLLFLPMHDLPAGRRAGLIPGKTYEYLASRKPILAAVPDGDARDLLSKFARVELCRPREADAMASIIERLVVEGPRVVAQTASEEAILHDLEREAITAKLARIFDAVLEETARNEATIASSPSKPRVAHHVPVYLPRSETFIYNILQSHEDYVPTVVAERLELDHLSEFPTERLIELMPRKALSTRVVRRARAVVGPPSRVRNLARVLRAELPDVLHAHFGWAGALAIEAEVEQLCPVVTSFYGRDLSDFRGSDYAALFERGALFLVEGPTMVGRLEELGCDSARIRLARIGIDLARFPMRRRNAGGEAFVIMQAARFVEKKGLDLTIRVLAEVSRELPAAELWLVGDGPERLELERQAGELGVADRVRFTGMLSYTQYADLTDRVDVCLQPSRTARDGDSEGGAPTVILEMQARGIPVVATRHADIPFVAARPDELLDEEDVPGLARAVVEVARSSDAARTERAAAGREFVERHHDRRLTTRQIERYYDEARLLHRGHRIAFDKELIAGA